MIITAASPKGGTGKTTLNVLFAVLMAAIDRRILIIDLDASCGISQYFGQIMKDVTSMEFLSGIVENFTGSYNARANIDIMLGNIKNEAVELIVFGKEYIPSKGLSHSITITLRQARCSRLFANPPSALPP
jgi:cellulose biosynthesis protein BcsQ